ncbi:MAG: GntR family transcriptional regulator [Verrucomicrobiota bacterium]
MQTEISRSIRKQIQNGTYEIGAFLPPIRQLARQFHTSITPVNKALEELAEAGYVEKTQGSGVRVAASHQATAKVQARPLVELIAYWDAPGVKKPSKSIHRLEAVEEWLTWSLSQSEKIRLVLTSVNRENTQQVEQRFQEILDINPDGLVSAMPMPPSPKTLKIIRKVKTQNIPFCYFAAFVDLQDCDRIHSDFESGQYQLTRYLTEKGHKNIARIAVSSDFYYDQLKQEGFTKALKEVGLTKKQAATFTIDGGLHSLPLDKRYQLLLRKLSSHLEKYTITAVMAPNDLDVAIVRRCLHELDRQDVEVVGYDAIWSEFDRDDWSQFLGEHYSMYKPFTKRTDRPVSVDTHLDQVALAISELITERLLGRLSKEPQIRTIPQTLVIPKKTV